MEYVDGDKGKIEIMKKLKLKYAIVYHYFKNITKYSFKYVVCYYFPNFSW